MGKTKLLLASFVLLSACTQEPVQVVYKGENSYGYNGAIEAADSHKAPALVVTKRTNSDRIFVTDNMSAAPVESEEEFRRVVDAIKDETSKSKTDITVVAIPVLKAEQAINIPEKPIIKKYGVSGLESVKPSIKPTPPQWYAQKATEKPAVIEGFIWPLRGKIVSTYGGKDNGSVNDGLNIAAPKGTEIKAAADGEVVYAGNELEGYGNMLIIRHNNGWASAYAHSNKMRVGLGAKVSQGQVIAEVGETGDVTAPQLHFGLRKDKKAVNPMDFLTDNFAANY